jgi:para-aminobenzoate synthetase component 2
MRFVSTRILVVDNYDSFVFNLVQYLGQLGAECVVRRNDEVTVDEAAGYDGVLFGVCLGHQAIGVAFGATVGRAPELLHGKTSEVHHSGAGVLAGLPDPFTATRYHSLAVAPETIPGELEVTGRTESGVVMAMRHRTLAIEGVQFHPESVLTQAGHRMLANWLAACGDTAALDRAPALVEQTEARRLSAYA